jgi:SAM-dependent methyltransferase
MPSIAVSIAKGVLLTLPPVQRLRTKRRLHDGYDRGKDGADYASRVFARHAVVADVSGLDVMEIGAGANLGTAALFARHGAHRIVCIDTIAWASTVPHGVEYLTPVNVEATDLPAASFDLIYSHAVFEHILNPDAAIAELARLLRPGGLTSHQIDLRDHRDKTRPLEFLQHSGPTWRLATLGHSDWACNRWRRGDYTDSFARQGFRIVSVLTTDTTDVVPDNLHPSFADRNDLDVIGIQIVAERL